MKEVLKEILVVNQAELAQKKLMQRAGGISLDLEKIQAVIGPRRVGKTSAMILAMKELLEKKGVHPNHILYFNFEDERVQLTTTDLDLLLQSWQELYPEVRLSDIWFFFDEIQAAPGWEKFLNRINETITKRIFFTGSNSSVLHTKIKSVMRGRSIAVEMLPLSFTEYCKFVDVKPAHYGAGKSRTIAAFYDYLQNGGYPETVSLPNQSVRTAFLQEYYASMLLRDIIEYNQLSNYSYLRSLYRIAAASIGKKISIRRMHNQLKANDFNVGMNSVYDVMEMAEAAYLFKRISRFDYSDSKRDKSDKKIYWLDNGLLNANTAQYTGNNGLLLENLAFRELYRRFGTIYDLNIYYYDDASNSCDFIVYREGGTPLPVQVSWNISQADTRDRELKGLLKACTYCNVKEAWLLTAEEESAIELEGVQISVKPMWKWLLEEQRTEG